MSETMVLLCAALLLTGWSGTSAAQEQKSTVEQIRKPLLQLPYYGVFDFLAFQYEKGTVTLVGFAYRPTLKTDATRAVKRVPGVDNVIDKIEELPVSINDDDLRWKTYYKIYGDPFLSRYAPGGGMLWGHMYGVVDNEADRNVAELRAKEVPGSFGVENYLVVESKSQSTKR